MPDVDVAWVPIRYEETARGFESGHFSHMENAELFNCNVLGFWREKA